jgi:O-antigen/teichoic acid export membrane protein
MVQPTVPDPAKASRVEAEVASMEESRVAAAAATTGGAVARGSAWNVVLGAVPQLYLVVVSIAAARFLGPELFGRQSFIAFVELSLATLFGLGIAIALQRFTASVLGEGRPGAVRILTRSTLWVAIPLATLAAGVLVVFALAGAKPVAAWVLAGVMAGGLLVQGVPQSVLAGRQRWRQMAMIGVIMGGVSTVSVVAVLAAGGGITGIFAVEAIAVMLTLAWMSRLVARLNASEHVQSKDASAPVRAMFRYAGVASIGVGLSLVVWNRSEFLFLNHYSSDSQIAFYSIAFATINALSLIPRQIGGTLVPAVATLQGAGEMERVGTGFARALRLALTIGFVLTAGAAALGPELLTLVYGSEFSAAGPLLLILLLPFPAIVIFQLASAMVEGMGHLRIVVVAGGIGAAVDIGLAFALIPHYGAVGAAISNSLAQLVVGIPPFIYSQRLVGGVRWQFARIGAAAAAATIGGFTAWGCVYVFGGGIAGTAVGATIGLLGFSLVARGLGIFTAEDALWLEETAGSALGDIPGRMIRFWAGGP